MVLNGPLALCNTSPGRSRADIWSRCQKCNDMTKKLFLYSKLTIVHTRAQKYPPKNNKKITKKQKLQEIFLI